jgi:hypothetical protein
LVDRGVLDLFRSAVRRWDRTVVFPEPDSPLWATSQYLGLDEALKI